MVKLNNEEYEANNITYKLKINRFSDMFEDEIMYRADGVKLLTMCGLFYFKLSLRFQRDF